ncbi:polysaccharide biosynthesis tyrosine autokinase [Limnobacter parvus]|uniref:non-specific protein-tyrosine kinase n=1 Tax=Limnobacter parvus TaxID=2939690 RepID=A0ABT1XF83_9BURK|nr:polysaccharide biosynthesis tyrosine autokinase [Limnobacter parvus]MCR2745920.1 polysaccharide biosynthesis tyrosine autokinase [Limnobacter parvus]
MIANKNPATMQVANVEEFASRSIGHILVSNGRLTHEAAEEIHRMQRENDVLFGETGIAMGLITREDVEFAIARQFEYSVLQKGHSEISEDLVSAYDPFGPKSEAFRELRTHLLLRWFETETKAKTLSIVSAQRGEGRSYVAANLAISFSQLGHKTLLIDTDFRNSKLHDYFGVSNRRGLSSLLQGKGNSSYFLPVTGIRNLSILPAGPMPPNPQELLSQSYFPELLNELSKHFDLLIMDTPAAILYSDATAVSLRSSASLVVVRQGHTKVEQLRRVNASLQSIGGNLLGSVLLDF